MVNPLNTAKKTPVQPLDWIISDTLVPYGEALDFMENRAAEIAAGTANECVWLLEHPPTYTAGTSAKLEDLLTPERFPVFETGRGGQYTYHGPGQRVGYVMLNLKERGPDVRGFVHNLEEWLIQTLAAFNVKGERRDDRVGVWVHRPELGAQKEDKIAAIGVRVRKWVTFHGVSLNINPDLEHFSGIVPCGVSEHGVTSLENLGQLVSTAEVDIVMKQKFEEIFQSAS